MPHQEAAVVGQADYINPGDIYEPSKHGFSQVVVAPKGARMVSVAGQMPIDKFGKSPSADFEDQVRLAFKNLQLALEGAGSDINNVTSVTMLCADYSLEREKVISTITKEIWPGHNKPASMLIPVQQLALDGLYFEIGAQAYILDK